ncbi:DUF1592 domain-containing protein [Agaribacter marinus]|uniref:Planctomycete cytochrome C n=1 Tax=Agaribacter marinus TaxID=1431249 RepID=A0AA37WKF5_9ALTE|nr:DUF1592 domain-containing protein [Agaribacter marinus]GLR71524.1 hypothetical protein GCM10007852_24320 [Agaribacter marinus]
MRDQIRKLCFAWGVALGAISLVVLCAFAFPLDGVSGQGVTRFLGRFHPLALHFPVVCLLLAGVFELVRFHPKASSLARLSFPLISLGAITAVVTVILGIMLASNEGHQGDLIARHRFGGIVVALLSCITAALYFTSKMNVAIKLANWSYRAVLTIAIVAMMFTAHEGGSLVHGERYLSEYAPKFLQPFFAPNDDEAIENNLNSRAGSDAETSYISPNVNARYDNEMRPFIEAYCARCHGAGKQEANVRLDTLDQSFMHFSSQYDWQKVLDVLGAHRMPPDDAKQPSDAERAQAINWIQDALHEYAYAKRAERDDSSMRRLNRRELNYTYQDLFNVDADFATHLSADAKSLHGYDTDANMLVLAMSDVKAYHEIARQAVERYVQFTPSTTFSKADVDHYFIEMEDIYHFCRLEGDKLSYQRAPEPIAFSELHRMKQQRKSKPIEYRYRDYGPLPFGPVPVGDVKELGEGRGFARAHEQFMLIKTRHRVGEVVVKVHAAKTQSRMGDNSMPKLRVEAGWRKEQSLRVKVIGEEDITAALDSPQESEFRFRLEDVVAPQTATFYDEDSEYNWLLLVLSNYARHEDGALGGSIYGQVDTRLASSKQAHPTFARQAETALASQTRAQQKWQGSQVPLLKLDAVEISITPVDSDAGSPFLIALPADSSEQNEVVTVKNTLSSFLEKAFRRKVQTIDIQRYLDLFQALRQQGDDFETAMRETMAASLISPEFLYIGFPKADTSNPGVDSSNADLPNTNLSNTMLDNQAAAHKRSDKEKLEYKNQLLASKISYFLWSSMPDETLRMLADKGTLHDPYVLSNQIDRMLDDPKAQRMSADFAKQWLQLSKFINITVSEEKFPDYGDELGELMVKQSVMRFQDNFHHMRDARDLYFSEHMMLNKPLANHYGIPNVENGVIQRIDLRALEENTATVPKQLGLLTHASVLTINSDGEDSHPIKRGVWMLERAFNNPPPPPPPSVPELDTSNPQLAGLSLKQKIEQHRELSGCSGCHEKIDPWGVLMENYDALGRWRDVTWLADESALAIDASSILPDGTKINNFEEFSAYLQGKGETKLMKALVHHFMLYALGRELDILDEEEADAIYASFRASGYRLSALTKAIVQSDAFTNRQKG